MNVLERKKTVVHISKCSLENYNLNGDGVQCHGRVWGVITEAVGWNGVEMKVSGIEADKKLRPEFQMGFYFP